MKWKLTQNIWLRELYIHTIEYHITNKHHGFGEELMIGEITMIKINIQNYKILMCVYVYIYGI